MDNNRKRLILDKSVFFGTSTEKLRQFASNHFLILPEVLIYECATAPTQKERQSSLIRFTETIRAGAYVCPSVGLIEERETQQGCPYGNIEDETETNIIRGASGIEWAEQRVQQMKDNEIQRTKKTLLWANNINRRKEGISHLEPITQSAKAGERIAQKDKQYLYQNYLQAIDCCLSVTESGITKDWVSWHYKRLTLLYGLFIGDRKGTSVENVEHHLQDMAYITLLCRGDVLLMKDTDPIILAKTAFPQKDIFDSVDVVPKKYVCNQRRC